jgi:hypothetical protein
MQERLQSILTTNKKLVSLHTKCLSKLHKYIKRNLITHGTTTLNLRNQNDYIDQRKF